MVQYCRVELRQIRLGDPEALPLLDGLSGEYERRYGSAEEISSVDVREFEPPHGVFVVLLDQGLTVAGGGLRRLSLDTCEVKRMWTSPDHRRNGLASAILDALEIVARDHGYTWLKLETGPAQPEAQSLYEGRGYRSIPTYGRYEQARAFEYRLGPEE
jgi:GNAT superfamily N-acetyltransferase